MRPSPIVVAVLCLGAVCVPPASLAAGHGTLDPSFGDAGKVTYDFGLVEDGPDRIAAVLTRADGSFYVVGTARAAVSGMHSIAILRYTRDGTIDASFAPVVAKGYDHQFDVFDAALEADGDIVVGANLSQGIYDGALAVCRFSSEGARDYGFGWSSEHPCAVAGMHGEALLVHSSGMIVVAGSRNTILAEPVLTAISGEGDAEQSFGEYGTAKLDYVPGYDTNGRPFTDLVEDSKGRLVAISTVQLTDTQQTDFLAARFTSAGTLDEDFAGDGTKIVSPSLGPNPFDDASEATAVAALPDDSIVIAGAARYSSEPPSRITVAMLDDDGKAVPSFNGGQPFDYEICVSKWPSGCVAFASDVAVLPSGGIVIAGSVSPYFGPPMQRMFALGLTTDGAPAMSFGDGYPNTAVTLLGFGSADAPTAEVATAMALQGDGVLIGGYAAMANDNVDFALARLRGRETAIFASSFEGG